MQSQHKIISSNLRIPALMLRLKKLELYYAIMKKLENLFSTEGNTDVSEDFGKISDEINSNTHLTFL